MASVKMNGLILHLTKEAAAKPGFAKALIENDSETLDRLVSEIRRERLKKSREELDAFLAS